jgi:hypothetical protein
MTDCSDFIEAARGLCSFIETQQSDDSKQFLLLTQKHLLKLYANGLNIPDILISRDIEIEPDISDTEIKALTKFIADRVPFSSYWVLLNPMETNDSAETGLGDLIDDLSDTYRDLKRGLILFDMEDRDAKENAIWHFKFHYTYHWGEHCIEALDAIHHYLHDNA